MARELVLYTYSEKSSRLLEELEELINLKALSHHASSLLERGWYRETELAAALQKAIRSLSLAHLPAYRHFKKIFVSDHGQIKTDWLVSDLGMRMLIMHADDSDPMVARMQLEVLGVGF